MYRFRTTKTRKDGRKATNEYYRCAGTARLPSTCRNMIPLSDIECWVDDKMTDDVIGSDEIIEQTVTPGHDYDDEIEQVELDIRELISMILSFNRSKQDC